MSKEIHFNAFDMNCVGHIQQGLWRHPRDCSADYRDIHYWMDYAKKLEKGLFDGIFFADVVGVYDVYAGNPDAAIRGAVQVPVNDPTMLIPAMAGVTTHLGFGVTSNLVYESPFLFARRMSTLDHLTGGRVGWNIVTGYLDSAARAIGLSGQMAHDDRYDLADEYMELVYKLWEGSWEDGAVQVNRADGFYADPAKVHVVHHRGRQYQVDAMHLSEPSPQRTPVLYQAGSSTRGRQFAATHAECVFVNGQSKDGVKNIVDDIRAQAMALGRAAADIKVFLGATIITAKTESQAKEKFAEYQRYVSSEAALVHAAASMGIDFAKYDMDEPIETGKSQAIVSNVEAMTRSAGPQWTKRKLLEQMTLGSRQQPLVGSAEQVADALMGWSEQAGVDGFNLSRTVVPECFDDIIELVVPILQERGVYKTAYKQGPLREKLFGKARLPASHSANQYRIHPKP
ncbi:N5,N10-methylene tetrahydromethanopterin reductase [Herbaspirillum sp. meg3]|uniref:LLM class flavin-dependent oxidoreductase n=1 Tax=Herbaspirillum sp. meg3 TaxID=2025949 RepID=UPI000B9919B6|nr:LLM class flavin-dependent oxidoreductase [Herbaspirillum sp. meg3]ASU40150.1 N5,N10-methylene tetrahydromethanopterin reductase [Herbaspirillum sp. meg3]